MISASDCLINQFKVLIWTCENQIGHYKTLGQFDRIRLEEDKIKIIKTFVRQLEQGVKQDVSHD